ncbi:MAG: hypothetical protein R3D46_00665 [Defluviimonas denitrificans]
MIESMVTATAHNLGQVLRGQEPDNVGTWNAVLSGGLRRQRRGVRHSSRRSAAQRQLGVLGQMGAPRQDRVRKYFIRKVKGTSEPYYEKAMMKMIGIDKLKEIQKG